MKFVTEMDAFGPGLRRTIAEARRALPGAEARARMYEQAGRAAHPDPSAPSALSPSSRATGAQTSTAHHAAMKAAEGEIHD